MLDNVFITPDGLENKRESCKFNTGQYFTKSVVLETENRSYLSQVFGIRSVQTTLVVSVIRGTYETFSNVCR